MTTLVGRPAESQAIAELVDGATTDSAALIIEGEPGLGKTTLWLYGLDRARRNGTRVLAARPGAAESVLAYAGLADLFAGIDPGVWTDLPAPQKRGLAAALLTEDDSASAVSDPRAVCAAFVTVLGRLAKESPLLVAIDDLHWLDASSATVVSFAARRLPAGVRLLGSARSETGPTPTAWSHLARPGDLTRLRLTALTISELQDVLMGRLGNSISRPRLLRIHQLSGGNPFYALELAREFDRRGTSIDTRLPDSLTELTRSRIGRLSDRAHDALLAAASLSHATVDSVSRALGCTPQHLLDVLAEAETNYVVMAEGNAIRFTHPLLAHAVYSSASPPRRRAMHRRLADVVTEPELKARHLALADPVGQPETLAALDAAAQTARLRGAPAAAAELLELAIGLGGGTSTRRLLLGECLFDAADPRRAREVLESVISESAPGRGRAEALQQLALVRLYDDGFLEAADLGRRAAAECTSDSALRVSILTILAFAELNTGSPEAAVASAELAVATAERLGLTEPLGRALGMRAIMRFMIGDGVAEADLCRAAASTNVNADVPVALRPNVQAALLRGWMGEARPAREALAQIGQRCAVRGEEGEMMFIAFQAVVLDLWLGDLPGAAATADDAMQRARQLGGGAPRFLALSVRGAVATYQGRVEDARRDLADALTAGAGSGYVLMMSWTIAMLGFLELSLGAHAKALAAVEPLLPMVQLMPRYSETLGAGFIPDAAEALIGLGRYDEAEPLVNTLERNGSRLDRAWMLAVGARCRALLLASRGDVAAGVVQAHVALAHHDDLAFPFERARTLLVLGRLERRQRHRQLATDALNEAAAIFEGIGAPLWVEQVRVELARGTAGRARSHGLTPTERRVADLAAIGMTNDDIAAALFLARKTIEVNLTRIYRKLGIHSRAELHHVMNATDSGRPRSMTSGIVQNPHGIDP